MGDDCSGEGLFQSLDPRRQEEFYGYLKAHEKGLLHRASNMLGASGRFWSRQELQEVARCCVQEAFIQLLRAMCRRSRPFSADSGGPEHVRNWLYEVTENAVLMALRKPPPLPQVPLDALYVVQESVADSDDPLVDSAHLNDLLARLDPVERAILELKLQGYHSNEIAPMLGMNPDAVRQRLSRAIEKLKKWHNRE